jgi:ketosteroid isomerase-like protein
MLAREEILKIITTSMARRRAGDKSVTAEVMAPDGTYALAADPSLLTGYPVGPSDANTAVARLIDLFTFHDDELLDAIVEGGRAAVRWKLTFSRGRDGAKRTTDLLQVWTFNDSGKVESLHEFGDTALIASMI